MYTDLETYPMQEHESIYFLVLLFLITYLPLLSVVVPFTNVESSLSNFIVVDYTPCLFASTTIPLMDCAYVMCKGRSAIIRNKNIFIVM